MEDVSNVCVCVCCREASTHGSAESPAAPNSASWVFILAKGVNRMLMCATSELCVCVCVCLVSVPFFFIIVCVTSAGNESHPPIADEDKGTDRFYMFAEAKMLENIQTLLKLSALFPKMGDNDRSLGTDAESYKESRAGGKQRKRNKVVLQRLIVRSYGNNIAQQ